MTTPADILTIIREDYLYDTSDSIDGDDTDLLYSNDFLLRQIGEAQKQRCYRQDLRHIFDEQTAAICEIEIVANQHAYTLDSRILRLHQVRLDDDVLGHVSEAFLSSGVNWRESSRSPSQFFVTGRTLTLDGPPTTGTLHLSVWREPLSVPNQHDDLELPDDAEKYGHWCAYRAFLRPDIGKERLGLAKEHRQLFDQAFGAEVSAQARAELLAYPALNFGPASRHGCVRQSFDIFTG